MQSLERNIQQRLGAAMQTLAFIEQRTPGVSDGRRMESLLRQCRQLVADLEHGFSMLQEANSQHATLRQQVDAASVRAGLLFELSPIPCVVVYDTGVIVEANAAATRFLNTSARYLHDKGLDLFLGADREAFRAWVQQVSRGTAREQRPVLLRPREQRPKQVVLVGMPESGGRVALVIMNQEEATEDLDAAMSASTAAADVHPSA